MKRLSCLAMVSAFLALFSFYHTIHQTFGATSHYIDIITVKDNLFPGDTLRLYAGAANNSGQDIYGDVFLGLIAPGGADIYFFDSSLNLLSCDESNPSSFTPFAERVNLPAGFTFPPTEFLSVRLPDYVPEGTWTAFAALTEPGSTKKGRVQLIGDISLADIKFNKERTPPPTTESFTLIVDKFGEGVVTSNIPGINCGNDCSESYPSGTIVVLTATPNKGSEFRSWSGCDSISGNMCTVTLNVNRTIFPTIAFIDMTIPGTTKVLDDATMQYLVKQVGSTYYFDPRATAVRSLQPGDVIVSGSGQGLLRRVITVSILADGLIAVETSTATLEDAIREGTISLTEKLTHANLRYTKSLIKGVKLREPIEASSVEFTIDINSVIYDKDGNENTTWDQVKITGSLTFNFETDFAISLGWSGIKEFKSVLITKTTQSLSVGAGGSIEFIDKKRPIKTFYFKPIPVGAVVGIPVVFIPEVTVYAGIKGEVGATLSTKVSMEARYTGGIYYKEDIGWKPINNFSPNFGFDPPSRSANATIKGYIGPEFKFLLYDVLGPYAGIEGYLIVEAGASSPLWWRLYGGIGAYAGAKIEIISRTLAEYRVDFNPWELELASGTTETITTPNTPSGPSSGEIGQSLTYTTGGASSNLGHSVEYRFDWGDGSYSNWSSSTSASHAWSSAGTYSVKAQARCATHTSVVSSWSSSISVTIKGNRSPNTPSNPSPSDGAMGVSINPTLSWSGGDPDGGDTVTYDVYFGTSSSFPLASYN